MPRVSCGAYIIIQENMERKYIDSIRLKRKPPKNSYLCDIPAVRWLMKNELTFSADVTFFVGENGVGKSTLLEGIAVASGFNPEGGTRNYSFSTAATHSELYNYLTVAKCAYPKDGFFLRAESMYNAATYLEGLDDIPCAASPVLDGYGGKSLHSRSHGESFLAVVQNRFCGNGLYLLDEPESALSPTRLLTLLCLIKDLTSDNSQFIIATHSPILMAYPDAQILKFSDYGIEPVKYKQTEHYQITKQFLDNPERMLKILFEGEKEDI